MECAILRTKEYSPSRSRSPSSTATRPDGVLQVLTTLVLSNSHTAPLVVPQALDHLKFLSQLRYTQYSDGILYSSILEGLREPLRLISHLAISVEPLDYLCLAGDAWNDVLRRALTSGLAQPKCNSSRPRTTSFYYHCTNRPHTVLTKCQFPDVCPSLVSRCTPGSSLKRHHQTSLVLSNMEFPC